MIYKGQKLESDIAYNEYEIAGEYEDVGKSGKSIEGRVSFNQMIDDIKYGSRYWCIRSGNRKL